MNKRSNSARISLVAEVSEARRTVGRNICKQTLELSAKIDKVFIWAIQNDVLFILNSVPWGALEKPSKVKFRRDLINTKSATPISLCLGAMQTSHEN